MSPLSLRYPNCHSGSHPSDRAHAVPHIAVCRYDGQRVPSSPVGRARPILDQVSSSARGGSTQAKGVSSRFALTNSSRRVLGGGGGGIEGFKHAVEHTGPANASWQEDMTQHRFEYKPDSIQRLVDSVKSELAELGEVDLEGTRDRFLREVQTLKGNLSSAHPTA